MWLAQRRVAAEMDRGKIAQMMPEPCGSCGAPVPSSGEDVCPACGHAFSERARSLVGVTLEDRYAIEAELGRGGMGVVYRAHDVNLHRHVALKVIAPRLVTQPAVIASFQREARALAQVRSQHVVQVHAMGAFEGSFFFVMELVTGPTLSAIVDEHAANASFVPDARSLTILKQVAAGLDAIHEVGTIHRDVKPDNVVIEQRSGRPVLIDFGLARSAAAAGDDLFGGTPEYCAPEQIQGTPDVGPKSDQYAFAILAFELLAAGRMPFEATSAVAYFSKHLRDPPTRISSMRPEMRALDPIFDRALSKHPRDRFESCAELVEAMESARSWPGVDRFPPVASRTSRPSYDMDLAVLVVDDDPAFAKLAGRAAAIAFHGVPARIEVATSGAAAVEMASARPPHLLLLDYDMPEMDGVETLARVRALAGGNETRVLVLSNGAEQERWRLASLGVQDFVAKPATLPALLQKLETIAKSAGWKRGIVDRRR